MVYLNNKFVVFYLAIYALNFKVLYLYKLKRYSSVAACIKAFKNASK